MSCRRVTVFGGTGFLGRRIVRHLQHADFAVRIASRHPDRGRSLFSRHVSGIEPFRADVNDDGSVASAVSGAWAVVNAVSLYVEHEQRAVDAMHDSCMPLGGMVLILNMLLGEITFGGVGSGLYGMLGFVVVTMFVAGLMVGRTPEYLGKKLEAREVKITLLALLSYPLSILGWTALVAATPLGIAGIANSGPHGFSEILYAYASTTGTNGSSFAGLSTNTVFYNLTLAAAMLMGRFVYAIPLLAVAGSLARKKRVPPSAGSVPTHSLQFVGLLVGVVLIMGGLTYFPALSLGPVAESGGDESRHSLSGALTGHFVFPRARDGFEWERPAAPRPPSADRARHS